MQLADTEIMILGSSAFGAEDYFGCFPLLFCDDVMREMLCSKARSGSNPLLCN
jgi:hypothetical protein